MPTITFSREGAAVEVPAGTNLLDACRKAKVNVPASCGGKGLCGKCRVRITAGDAPPHRGYEQAMSPAEADAGWRLACLVTVQSDLTIETPGAKPMRNAILTTFSGRNAAPDGAVRSVPLQLTPPTIADQMCDIGRISRGLGLDDYPRCGLPLLRELHALLRERDWQVNAILFGDELLGVEPYHEHPRVLGMAFDLGTTTIAGALFDLPTGELLAVESRTNPQAVHGDDVVTRIEYASRDDGALQEMQTLAAEAFNEMIADACNRVGAAPEQVYLVAVAGNTTMHHLLLGLDPRHIAQTPFIPVARRGLVLRARDAGIRAGLGARLYALPNISAYVGGDIVAGLLAHGIHDAGETILLIDVGTNGEMALRANGKTYACSTAAGPAFEGARIAAGMRAATGAICEVSVEGDDLAIKTVDRALPARGLCGTGLLDAVAVLLTLGVIDESGRILDDDELEDECPDLPDAIKARVIEHKSGAAVVLAEASGGEPAILLTQRDVREFQLAKGAISAGAEVMFDAVGIDAAQIDRVLLAGGFGTFLKPASAIATGLLPEGIDECRIEVVGNAALAGTRLGLLAEAHRAEAERIAKETEYLELSGRPEFQSAFAEAMLFPEG